MSTKLKENIAEICIAAGGLLQAGERHSSWEDVDPRDLTDALISAAELLAEIDKPSLWERYDWLLTCDNIAAAIVQRGETVTSKRDVQQLLAEN